MQQIDSLSNDANQQVGVVLDDGTVLKLHVVYSPAIQRWFIDVDHKSFSIRGLMLCVHPNLLRQWRNTIDFGLACLTLDGVDPLAQEDFNSGRVLLYVLDKAEVQQVEVLEFQ